MTDAPDDVASETYRDTSSQLGFRSENVIGDDGENKVCLVPKNADAQADFQRNMWEFASGK